MGKLFGFLLVLAMAIVAIKLAIALLILAGLIFRTKETIGLLLVLSAWAVFKAYPMISIGIVAVLILYAVIKASKPKPSALLVDHSGDDQD
ncbi:hypothetical protein [uncultured Sphingomonas sp.]|uniref:hypothetical protein n=1 Tax=uncultured Sphingomonas sp. TaxID=158754 RepID=UPI0025CCA880|nr:hypothetical protein [uncultured Sphingomonas sp.]